MAEPNFLEYLSQPSTHSGLASFSTPWVRSQGALLILAAEWTAVAATNGTWTLDGGIAPNAAATLSPELVVAGVPTPSGVYGTGLIVGAVAGNLVLVIKNPMQFHRLTYTRVGGGGAGQFTAWAYERPD